jgi:hypothetical protein
MQASTASMKRLCAAFSTEISDFHRKSEPVHVKVERYDSPIILTRKQTKEFLHERIFDRSRAAEKVIDWIASLSGRVFIVARSNLFLQIDAPYNFQCLNPVYKQFLQDLIIDSRWKGLVTLNNKLSLGEHIILVKDVGSPLLDRLQIILEQKGFAIKEIVSVGGKKIEEVIQNNYKQNFGADYLAPANAVSVKLEESEEEGWVSILDH